MVWQSWRATAPTRRKNDSLPQIHFLAGLAVASAALSTLTIAAMWIPAWMISSCVG
jgi:hypothetical protein